MKRAAAPALSPYAALCERLGVQPKQFTVLLGVAGGAILLLTVKFLLSGPKEAAAADPVSPATAAAPAQPAPADPAAAPSAAPAAPAPAPSAFDDASSGARGANREVAIHLDTAPRRDPFRPFIERPKAAAHDPTKAPSEESLKPPDFTQFRLRATMDGAWVIINAQTLRKGDIVGLAPDGTPIKLRDIGHRSATLEWRGKSFELTFFD